MWTTKKVKAYRVLTDWQNNTKIKQTDRQIDIWYQVRNIK